METLSVRTSSRTEMREITREVAEAVARSGAARGLCAISVPHTTAGITVNENADASVREDIEGALERLVPWSGPYSHEEGNSAAHIRSALVGHSVVLPVEDGRLVLGTWQGIFLCEFDGPRSRKVHVQVIAGSPQGTPPSP